jgi:hypothetical protein
MNTATETAPTMDKQHCLGCEDDFYNGKNQYGIVECWHLKDARLEPRLLIHIEQPPPYHQKPELRPICYHKKRFATVKPESLDAKGYWKS